MGKVFRATRRTDKTTVAVKALAKRHQLNPPAIRAFLQEAAVLHQLNHPRIVPLYGVGPFPNGGLFLVMQYVNGENLAQRISRGPLSIPQALRIAVQTLSAVVVAHDCGVIHCDLKPANLLLDGSGNVLVADFGFAHVLTAQRWCFLRKSAMAARGGTPAFAAPEQLSMTCSSTLAAHPGPAVDIYAVGKILIAMLLGTVPPTHEETLAVLAELPAELREVCEACTSFDPADRYSTAAELLTALKNVQSHRLLVHRAQEKGAPENGAQENRV